MRRNALVFLCLTTVLACVVRAQRPVIEPLHVASGAVLTFHLQTRLHTNSEDEMDGLPQGTILQVKMLTAIDSGVDHDGTPFCGVIVSSVNSGSEIIVHPDAEVRGLLALLRSKSHPDGFRYELLITQLTDHGKSYSLTASLNNSFFDGQPATSTKTTTK
jgi:hypothetical protein